VSALYYANPVIIASMGFNNLYRVIGGTIIDYEVFEISGGLPQNRINCLADVSGDVLHSRDDSHAR